MKEIYVIGSMSIDLVTKSIRRPKKGETLIGETFFMTEGGKGANQAVSAARLGSQVHMIGCVGDDSFGRQILENLIHNGVFVENVETIPGKASGIAQITLAEGDNSIIVVPGANSKITIEKVSEVLKKVDSGDIVILQNEIPLEVIEFVIDTCYTNQITTIYNPAPFIKVDLSLFEKVTYFTPNETEVVALFGRSYEDIIVNYKNKMIVTLGSQGATYFDDKLIKVPGQQVDAVDTTGAGDTFNGALAVALSEGKVLKEAIEFANKVASISVQGLGAQGGMPYRKDV